MTRARPVPLNQASQLAALHGLPESGPIGRALQAIPRGLRETLLIAVGILLVASIAALDVLTGPYLSFGLFYLIPVVFCAWYGGFTQGLFLALAASIACDLVDAYEQPNMPRDAQVWNGIATFCTAVLISSLVARLQAGIRRERLLARTDPLTGTSNGRTFYETFASEVVRARRYSQPLTLVYLDLDNFKQLNDRWGHAAGDAALIQCVQTIQDNVRETDLLARLGGDEFALLLPRTNSTEAVILLDRLHELLQEEMARAALPLTVSVGAVTFQRPPLDIDLMIQRADQQMYLAKSAGKGRVEYVALAEGQAMQPGEGSPIERRATARVFCTRPAKVRLQGEEEAPADFATILDISPLGIGLQLEKRHATDTVLIVEPLAPGATALLARIQRVTAADGGWLHGCLLSTRLSDEELRGWFEGQLEEAVVS